MMEIQLYVALFFLKFDVTVHDNIPDYVSSNSSLSVLSIGRILESYFFLKFVIKILF